MTRLRKVQLAFAAAAVVCVIAAGMVQEPRTTRSDLGEIIPGRAFMVTYLWIRADALKEQGRYYDAMQQAELICRLQRRFPGVWSFHAWNMAWNISVATRTPQERWRWVHNGLRLLRDSAIPLNRKSLVLYKELGWIFFFKIGGYLDDMHWVYKRQWASRMQDLLGAPPQGSPEQVVAAFRPIAEAPIDKDPGRQGREAIQLDQLQKLRRDPGVEDYVKRLAAHGVTIDEVLLSVYDRYSTDEPVRVVRIAPPKPESQKAEELFRLINDAEHAAARSRLLAFVRAQILWNVYRMDPAWMLSMMERYGPLDWRLPQPHGLYWLTYGRHVCKSLSLGDIDSLNTDRVVFGCLKALTWRGRLTFIDRRPRSSAEDVLSLEAVRATSDMDLPDIRLFQLPDLRFVEPLQAEYLHTIEAVTRRKPGDPHFANHRFKDGHINYLAAVTRTLYAAYRRKEAQQWFDWVKRNYAPPGPEWQMGNVEDFVLYGLRRETDPSRDMAESQIGTSLVVAFVALARGDRETFVNSLRYARKAHRVYHRDLRNERMRLADFNTYLEMIASMLLSNPRAGGYNLDLIEREQLYKALDGRIQQRIYPRIRRALEVQCELEGLDFDKAFPPPPGPQQQPGREGPDELIPGVLP